MTKHSLRKTNSRLGILGKPDISSPKKEENGQNKIEAFDYPGNQLAQRCVIVQRDEKGYGLTVSGDNPVFVQSVKEDGAAARAGVQQGDRIIKVNGTLVTNFNHVEVVKLIKSGSYVALTLLGRPSSCQKSPGMPQQHIFTSVPVVPQHSNMNFSSQKPSSPTERITGPQPVDSEKQQQLSNSKIHTIRMMLEQELAYVEKLRSDFARSATDKTRAELSGSIKRCKTLEEQLFNLTGDHPDCGISHSPKSPRSPPPLRTSSELGKENRNNQEPPALPARRYPLPHQMSLPNVTVSNVIHDTRQYSSQNNESSCDANVKGPIHHSENQSFSSSHSMESMQRSNMPLATTVTTTITTTTSATNPATTAWVRNCHHLPHKLPGAPTHSRQRSSPDALLHQTECLRQQHFENVWNNCGTDLSRSHSEITGPRKFNASDSFGESDNPKRRKGGKSNARASSFGTYDNTTSESPHITPPGTPPPPYGSTDVLETIAVNDEINTKDDIEGIKQANNSKQLQIQSLQMKLEQELSYTEKLKSECAQSATDKTKAELSDSIKRCKSLEEQLLSLISEPPVSSASTNSAPIPSSFVQEKKNSSSNQTPDSPPENNFCSAVTVSGSRLCQQHDIISMEDDEFPSDNESGQVDDHGPFNCLSKLRKHPAHLAVFTHYLISNSDPSSLFFYLVTDLYKEGNAKEMKKWAYEIHSSFLVPGAPLRINNVDENILHEIDFVLQNDLDKEEILRKVFWKARKKASDELTEQLEDFRSKRTLGLGSFFGPPDAQLDESIHDKVKELKIIEELLLPSLTELSADIENANNKTCVVASSLATLLYKLFGIKSPSAVAIIERCPIFISKEKSRLKVFNRNKKVQLIQGHHFIPQHYFNVTYCNHCQLIIWGVGNQGYQCQICEMNIHKTCVKVVEETCIGAMRNKKDKKKDRMSGLMENIIGKKRPLNPSSSSNVRRSQDELSGGGGGGSTFYGSGEGGQEAGDRSYSSSRVEKLKNRYETLCEGEEKSPAMSPLNSSRELPSQSSSPNAEPAINGDSNKRGPSIGRSESLRARRENQRHSFRKRSDPNIPQSKSDAEDTTGSSLHPSASSSSCSSSTRSLDSPSNSLETVRQSTAEGSPTPSYSGSQSGLPRREDSNDSDFDAEIDPPNWAESVDWEIIKHIKPKERKRQEVINELFYTERTHVRNLKVLERVFFRPMQQDQVLPNDQIKLLFANLEEMLEIHGNFNSIMKNKKAENIIVGDIGNLMLEMFDGQSGENLKKAAAEFCRHQSIALESLRNKQKKDPKLAQFLTDAEGNSLCRRFQLKDIIPTGMQRLTKYPLLLENLAKYTPPNTEEYSNLIRAVECCKENLNYVNQKIKETENNYRLVELQKKLDKGSFDKVDHPIAQEFRNLDLTKHKLIHEGCLTWRMSKQKVIDLTVLLLENFLVLLQKQDEKYVLKFHKEETKLTHSPIIKLNNLLTRNVAVDNKAFFIVSTSTVGPQIYELVAISTTDRNTWIRNITEAVDAYKAREGKSKRLDQNQLADGGGGDVPENFEFQDKSKEQAEEEQENQESPEIEDKIEQDRDQPQDKEEPSEGESEDNENDDDYVTISSMAAMPPPGPSTSASPQAASPSGQTTPTSPATSPSLQRPPPYHHFQRVENLQITEGPILIEPSEVVVSQEAILQTAEPVLTPLEKLRRKDTIIRQELEEKQNLVAEILQIPKGEYEHIADIASQPDVNKDNKELVLAAIAQANRLTEIINDSLTVSEEDAVCASAEVPCEEIRISSSLSTKGLSSNPPSLSPSNSSTLRRNQRMPSAPISKLMGISNSLNQYLIHLLATISEREEEREKMRKELRMSREQIYMLHESRRQTPTFQPSSDNVNNSRPNSFISLSSCNTSEPCDSNDSNQLEEADELCSPSLADDVKTPTYNDQEPIKTFIDLFDEVTVSSSTTSEKLEDISENMRPSNCTPSPVVLENDIEISVDEEEPDSKANNTGDSKVNNHLYGAIF